MRTAASVRFIALVFATAIMFGMPFSYAVAQSDRGPHWPEGCLGRGVSPTVDYYLPHLWGSWVIASDERRTAEQLAATFADPANALARLDEWCWVDQAERVYVSDERRTEDRLVVDVSIHDFLGSVHDPPTGESVGAERAQRWFGDQRANDLGLKLDVKTRKQLEEDLNEAELGQVKIEALDNIVIDAYYNDAEYTLYARRGNLLVRVSVSGEPSAGRWRREVIAYQILAQIFGVNLFPPRA